ncbi:hypothetical protein ACI797_10995 [Geodermatophilus sp. SYSU D00691]
MTDQLDVVREDAPEVGEEPAAAVAALPVRRPNLTGDIDEILTARPVFRRRLLGYERLQVDNYVGWAEAGLLSARRETDDLLQRFGRCYAELQLARQRLVHSPGAQQLARVSERIGTMLQLAADEAAEITATAAEEAEAWKQRAREVTELAAADAARVRRETEADRAEAAAARQRALAEVAELLERAGDERHRLDTESARERARLDEQAAERRARDDAEAVARLRRLEDTSRRQREAAEAQAAERLAALAAEVAELERRRDTALAGLRRMNQQVNEAVATLATSLPPPGLQLVAPPAAS